MRTRLIQIGNSRGIRIPKTILEEAGLGDEVDLQVQEGSIVISRSHQLRQGWAEAAAALAERKEDVLIHPPTATRFDAQEWEW